MKLKISVHLEVGLALKSEVLLKGSDERRLPENPLLETVDIGVIEALVSCGVVVAVDSVDSHLSKHS